MSQPNDGPDLPELSGDPNALAWHDGTEYCMDITAKDAGFAAAKKYVPWYAFLNRIPQSDRSFFQRIAVPKAKKIPGREYEYSSMNGMTGGFYVDDDEEFTEIYARLWADKGPNGRRHNLFIVEKPSPVFKLYMDLDFEQLSVLSNNAIEAVSRVVDKTVRRYWTAESNLIVCCSNSTDKIKTQDGTTAKCKKTGIHLHWPNIFADSSQILHVLEAVKADLQLKFGARSFPMNAWDKIVDLAIYSIPGKKAGSGLRLLGSVKYDKCKNVDEKTDKCTSDCSDCYGEGKVLSDGHGRPYMLFMVLSPDEGEMKRNVELEKEYLKSFPRLLRDTKIRSTATETSVFEVPPGAPMYIPEEKRRTPKTSAKTKHVQLNDPAAEACEQAIRAHTLYADIVVTSLSYKKSHTETVYRVHVSGNNSRFCQNIGREHLSNRIWFEITKSGVFQKCHDDGESPEQKYGPCKQYASGSWPLSVQVTKTLFPNDDDTCATVLKQTTSHEATAQHVKSCVQYGDKLCKDLHKKSWSATLLFNNQCLLRQRHYVNGLRTAEYKLHHPEHLGTKHNDGMRSLGYDVDIAEETADDDYEENHVIPGIKSLLQLEEAVCKALENLVKFVAFEDSINVYATYVRELVKSYKKTRLDMTHITNIDDIDVDNDDNIDDILDLTDTEHYD